MLDIHDVYENSSDDDQEFVQNLALFLTSFLTAHLKVINKYTVLRYRAWERRRKEKTNLHICHIYRSLNNHQEHMTF